MTILNKNTTIRLIFAVAALLLSVTAGAVRVSAAEIVRYSSPAAGVTPEIPVNSQGLPALPGEPQVLGANDTARREPSGRRLTAEEMRQAETIQAQTDNSSSAADPLTTYGSFAECVQGVGFDFPLAGAVAAGFEGNVLYRGLAGTVMEVACLKEDGSYLLLRKGIGHSDLAADVKECDQAIVMRDVAVPALTDFLAAQISCVQDASGIIGILQELVKAELQQENCSAIVRFAGTSLKAVTLYSEHYTIAVIVSGI